jgi:deazaflavin-dependent oxidoreductase (nitroreductase family)
MGHLRLSASVRRLLRAPNALFRWGLGPLLRHRFLQLTHRGRRTGRLHQVVLEVVEWRPADREAVVLSGLGRDAQWYRNVQAGGAVEVRIGRARWAPAVRVLEPAEATAAFAGYERRNRWAAPIVRRVLSRLAGFDYDGSAAGRERLVAELPLVAFRACD